MTSQKPCEVCMWLAVLAVALLAVNVMRMHDYDLRIHQICWACVSSEDIDLCALKFLPEILSN